MELTGVSKVILGALRGGERSGYEIKRLVDRSTRFFWAASYGGIYPELRRLEEAGLVEGTSEPRGGRARRVFRLTPRGSEALHAWLTGDELAYELRDEGLLKLFFADSLSNEEALRLVRDLRDQRQGVLDRLRTVEASLPPHASGYRTVVLDYGLGMHEWVVEWCSELERRLTSDRKEAARP